VNSWITSHGLSESGPRSDGNLCSCLVSTLKQKNTEIVEVVPGFGALRVHLDRQPIVFHSPVAKGVIMHGMPQSTDLWPGAPYWGDHSVIFLDKRSVFRLSWSSGRLSSVAGNPFLSCLGDKEPLPFGTS